MADLKNDFSWSPSRNNTFQDCARRYYYQYYLSWGGWNARAEKRSRRAYVLKNLKSRQMWAGTKVHAAIERCLNNLVRGIKILPPEESIEITLEEMRREFASSRDGRYLEDPKREPGLVEHHYKENIPASAWRDNADLVRRCLGRFYTLPLFDHLRTMPKENFIEIERLTSFEFEGTKIWVVLDLFYRDGDSKVIVDWKTGKAGDRPAPLQLATYAMYAQKVHGFKVADLRGCEVNLQHGVDLAYDVSESEAEHTKATLRGCIKDMKSLLVDEINNVPIAEEGFALARDESSCRFCNFKEICPKFAKN
ncbi:MAG: PD-(D/E)XK nuclease family protein [Planctomycetota bacterium]